MVSEYGTNWYGEVCMDGSHAYYISPNTGLDIFDVSDPSRPVKTARYDCHYICDAFAVRSGIAYLPCYDDLEILDVSDDTTPRRIGLLTLPNAYFRAASLEGNLLFLGDNTSYGQRGLRIVDVTNPRNPILRASLALPGVSVGMAVCGDYVYVADSTSSKLFVVRVANPDAPQLAATISRSIAPNRIKVHDNHLYLLESGGISIMSLADPVAPAEVGRIVCGSLVVDIDFKPPYAFFTQSDTANGFEGLRVFDVGDPAHPVNVGRAALEISLVGLAVSGDRVFTSQQFGGLLVFDASDPRTLRIASENRQNKNLVNMASDGSHAYAVSGGKDFVVYDHSAPDAPVIRGKCTLPFVPNRMFLFPPHAYVGESFGYGNVAVDFSDPMAPVVVGNVDPNSFGSYSAAVVDDSRLYLGDGSVMYILEQVSPLSFSRLSTLYLQGNVNDIRVIGDLAYVVCDDNFFVVRVYDSSYPRILGTCNIPGLRGKVQILNGRAYVAGGLPNDPELFVLDVSVVVTPRLVWQRKVARRPVDTLLESGRFFVLEKDLSYPGSVLLAYDLSNPDQPAEMAEISIEQDNFKMCRAGGFALAAGTPGLTSIDLSQPRDLPVLSRTSLAYPCLHLAVQGSFVYSASYDRLEVIDFSDRMFPYQAALFPLPDYGTEIAVAGRYVVVGVKDLAGVFLDVANPFDPQPVAVDPPILGIRSVKARGNLAYIASDYQGLVIVDVSSSPPAVVGSFPSVNGTLQISDDGKALFVVGGSFIHSLDVSNPASPSLISTYSHYSLKQLNVSALNHAILYVNGYDDTIIGAVNVANPAAPQLINTFNLKEMDGISAHEALPCRQLWTDGSYLYGAIAKMGYPMVVIDYSNVVEPRWVTYLEHGVEGMAGCKSGDFHFLGTRSPGKVILMQSGVPGDLDGNSTVNAADLVLFWDSLSGTLGRPGPSRPFAECLADFNRDGSVDVLDGLLMEIQVVTPE
ncbi:MAG: hypothetical protein KA419_14430 [Acidobacteria bacterium]|nr:hypothetical protein [Acidobacteriota bacterium]